MTKRNSTTIETAEAEEVSAMPSALQAHIEQQHERILRARSVILSIAKALDAQDHGEIDFVPGLEAAAEILLDSAEQIEAFEIRAVIEKARSSASSAHAH